MRHETNFPAAEFMRSLPDAPLPMPKQVLEQPPIFFGLMRRLVFAALRRA